MKFATQIQAVLLAAGAAIALAQPSATTNAPALEQTLPNGRRAAIGEPTVLAFKQFTVEQLVPFIVESTGKVVMPMQDVMSRKVTVINDKPIPRDQALDLVFMALLQNGVAVIENATTITLRDVADLPKQTVPVIGPDERVRDRSDLGSIVEKVFSLKHSTAKGLGDALKDKLPDYGKLSIDEDSNRIALIGNIAFLQRIESLIDSLDRPAAGALQTETFVLRFADAEVIKTNIEELFGGGGASAASRANRTQNQNRNQNQPMFRFPGQGGGQEATSTAATEIRVTANTQQNSVTVAADPAILSQIRSQITDYWDQPLKPEQVNPKVYDLKNSDPVKVAAILEGLFGRGSSGARTGGQQGQQQQGGAGTSQGVGRLAGQFSFQAMPDSSRLIVVAKSPDNIAAIDEIIAELDKPQTAGLPSVIELKHANAEDLAEQLNALLAQDGTLAQVRRAASGLSQAATGASPFAENATATGAEADAATTPDNLSFWWQRSRTPTDRRPASNLIGQLRIVPVWRQNALLVVSPPEYRQPILDMIDQLDRPGRQVLISAIIAAVSMDDATALGLRWSSQSITPSNADNSISIGNSFQGSNTGFADSLFNSSVLQTNVNLNVLLQALAEKTAVSLLSEPKIFTSDNQEAVFFDGQDIPFISDTQNTDTGTQNQSFDYKAVGLSIAARPRITVNGDVDLRVNVVLSNTVPGQTLFGGAIINRRETTTQLIVKNKQTVVISGLLKTEDSDIVRKVPILGDIPGLDLLFKSTEKSKTNSELLVFITPIVVNNATDNEGMSEPYNQRLDRLKETIGAPGVNLPAPGDKDVNKPSDKPAETGRKPLPTNPGAEPDK